MTGRGFGAVVTKAAEVLRKYPLCDACLGRLFASLGYGLTNSERGRALKTLLLMESYAFPQGTLDSDLILKLAETGFEPALKLVTEKLGASVSTRECYLCRGLISRLDELVEMAVEALQEYEYETFLVGCTLPPDVAKREEDLWRAFSIDTGELLKAELTREVGKKLQSVTGKTYDPKNPDVTVILRLDEWKVEVEPSPLFIYGRYRKLVRGIPQNPWPEMGPDEPSIETLITAPIIGAAKAEGAVLHAAGREDVDVRTLGRGRPFIVEVKKPRKRHLDLKALEREINERASGLIEVEGLKFTTRDMVSRLKAFAEIARKTYRARVVFKEPVSEEDARLLERVFKKIQIRQRTPLRVAHRRADKVRVKTVYAMKAEKTGERELTLTIVCQGGLYVKELIHGDRGRTKPSVAEVLGKEVESITLDVIDIEEYGARKV